MTTEPGRERGRALRTAVALGLALAGSCSCGATRELTPVVQAGEARTMSIADIRTRLWRRPEVRLVPPSDAERDALEQLVTEASSLAEHGRDTLGVLGPRLAASGFVAELVQVGPTRAIALLDPADRGAGAYFFRVRLRPQDEGPRRLLQAPHAFHDVGTGPLAARSGPTPAKSSASAALSDYLAKAAAASIEGHRAFLEGYALRRRGSGNATGAIQWMLNNDAPSSIWHLFQHDLTTYGHGIRIYTFPANRLRGMQPKVYQPA